jgi:hypothetical protein
MEIRGYPIPPYVFARVWKLLRGLRLQTVRYRESGSD